MFCSICGSKMKDEAKFCGNCGTKAETINNPQEDNNFVKKIEIAPFPLSYKNLDLKITDASAEGPDNDGDMRLTVKYAVTNNTDNDWEFYETRCQLFSANGLIVDETRETTELTIATGETENLEASFWSIKAHALGAHPKKAHIVLTFTASEFAQQKLGEVKIPENPFEVVSINSTKIDNLLSLVSCSLWKTEPDSDKDCRVEIKALIQNHTLLHLPEVKMLAKITDAKGREVTDASCSEEMRPAALAVMSGSGYTKEKKLVGANAELTLRAYWPVAVGVDQRQGMTISKTENEEVDNSIEDEKSSEIIQEFVDRYNLIAATKILEKNLSCDAEVLSILKIKEFDLSLESRLIEDENYIFLVNIHSEKEKILLKREDAKIIAFRLGKYIFDFKDNNIHPSLHNDFDEQINIQIYVALDDEVIYNLEVKNNIDKSLRSYTNESEDLQRKALFTFSHRIKADIDNDGINELYSIMKCNSTKSLQALCPSGNRSSKTEEAFQRLDQQILPHMSFAVFFDNFSDPSLIFVDPEELYLNTTEIDSRLRGARITYFALWESDSSDGRQLEVAVEVSVELDVVDGIDFENFDGVCDSEVHEQLFECKNMFNFFFNEFEFEDNEGLNHEWSASFISEN